MDTLRVKHVMKIADVALFASKDELGRVVVDRGKGARSRKPLELLLEARQIEVEASIEQQ
jgi:hypothetical protein